MEKQFKNHLVDKVKEIVMLLETDKEDISQRLKSVRFPKLQIFDKIFCTNLQSPVWSRHVSVPQWDTNMVAGK